MSKVSRIYPESRTGLINWIEQNFHDIDEFAVTFKMKDGTTMTVYDCYSALNAIGLLEFAKLTCNELAVNGEFIPKK
jgi:hypothetical protein